MVLVITASQLSALSDNRVVKRAGPYLLIVSILYQHDKYLFQSILFHDWGWKCKVHLLKNSQCKYTEGSIPWKHTRALWNSGITSRKNIWFRTSQYMVQTRFTSCAHILKINCLGWSNTFQDMNYCPVRTDRQTDRQTDGQKVMHMSPLCKVHRWAQKCIYREVILLFHSELHGLC